MMTNAMIYKLCFLIYFLTMIAVIYLSHPFNPPFDVGAMTETVVFFLLCGLLFILIFHQYFQAVKI